MRTTLLFLLILVPETAIAGGYAIPNENAREIALSQATVAAQNGAEAAFQNPSALAGQKGLAAAASLELLFNSTTWSDPELGSATTLTHVTTPPSLSIAYGNSLSNGMNWGAGLNFQLPGGGNLFWPYNWPGATRVQSVTQRLFTTKLSGGFEPIQGVKFGASVNYVRITEELTQQINFLSHSGLATLGLGGGAFSFGLSGEFHVPNVPLVFGIDYVHKADMTLHGSGHFQDVPIQFQPTLQDQNATERVTTPNVLYVGAAYTVIPGLLIMGAWNLERWSVYKSDTFVGDRGFMISVPRNYNNAYVFRLAAEYAHTSFLPALTLRIGGLRSISSQPTDTISPSLTDADSWAFSVGAGYDILLPGLRVDIGYQHAILDRVTATGTEAFPGSYKTTADFLSFGLAYRADI
jgi:long-chain fatty acid transport protein